MRLWMPNMPLGCPKYAGNLGVDIENLLVSQPDFGEQALDIVEPLRSGAVDVIVIDSVAALTPKVKLKATWVIRTWATFKHV